MLLETILITTSLFIGLAPLVVGAFQGRSRVGVLGVVVIAVAAFSALAWSIGIRRPTVFGELAVNDRPVQLPQDGYVSSKSCRACHLEEYLSWHASYHRTMTQVASPAAVLGDFDDVELHWQGRRYYLEHRGDKSWVQLDDPSWPADGSGPPPRVWKQIVMTTGSHHLQTYWFATGRQRRLGQFPFYYSLIDKQWIPDGATYIKPPLSSTAAVPSDGPARWHSDCIKCHSTHGKPRYDFERDSDPDTQVAELGISCEACHGPGDEHVRANSNPQRRYSYHLSGDPDPTIVQPQRLDPRRASQVCGQCHSVFGIHRDNTAAYTANGFAYRPGHELTDDRQVLQGHMSMSTSMREGAFWSDGMVRVSGREYNGLIETPCHQRGEMSCLSCHQMHKPANDPRPLSEWTNDQLAMGMEGDQACLQCHTSLAGDLAAHTYHPAGSAGSRCYNCHMPYTTYGLHKAIRSHQVDSPNVAASLATGRPNACNQCHLDRTLAWTGDHLQRWYGQELPALSDDERSIAASVLWALTGDAGQRALMAWTFSWPPAQKASGSDWIPIYLIQLLDDPYDAVRFIAHRSLRQFKEYASLEYDSMEPAADRKRAGFRAWQIWMASQDASPRGGRQAVLFDASGQLRKDVFARLLRKRNDRPLRLIE